MNFESSAYFDSIPHVKYTLSFGNFYFMENFMIAEFNEGIHYDWEKLLQVVELFKTHYKDPNKKIAYISNRVNCYSMEPILWSKLEKNYDFIFASATVSYSASNYMNATIEKQFTSNSLKRCKSLAEAIKWCENLEESKPS